MSHPHKKAASTLPLVRPQRRPWEELPTPRARHGRHLIPPRGAYSCPREPVQRHRARDGPGSPRLAPVASGPPSAGASADRADPPTHADPATRRPRQAFDRASFRPARLRTVGAGIDIPGPKPPPAANILALTACPLALAPQAMFSKRVGSIFVVFAFGVAWHATVKEG